MRNASPCSGPGWGAQHVGSRATPGTHGCNLRLRAPNRVQAPACPACLHSSPAALPCSHKPPACPRLWQQHEQAVHSALQRRELVRLQQLQAQRRKGGRLQQRHQLGQLHGRFRAHGQRFLGHGSQQLASQAVRLCEGWRGARGVGMWEVAQKMGQRVPPLGRRHYERRAHHQRRRQPRAAPYLGQQRQGHRGGAAVAPAGKQLAEDVGRLRRPQAALQHRPQLLGGGWRVWRAGRLSCRVHAGTGGTTAWGCLMPSCRRRGGLMCCSASPTGRPPTCSWLLVSRIRLSACTTAPANPASSSSCTAAHRGRNLTA